MIAPAGLVLVAHGTRSPAGRDRVRALRDRVRQLLPDRQVLLGYVDVEEPRVDRALASAGQGADVVPLFLSAGMHVRRDVLDAARVAHRARVHPHLGARGIIEDLLVEAAAGIVGDGRLVLASAGSSHEDARREVVDLADRVAGRVDRDVVAGFLGGAGLQAVDLLPGSEGMLTHLLAPGFFSGKVARLAADHDIPCTAPVLVSPAGFEAIAQTLAQDAGDQRTGSLLTPRWKFERNQAG